MASGVLQVFLTPSLQEITPTMSHPEMVDKTRWVLMTKSSVLRATLR